MGFHLVHFSNLLDLLGFSSEFRKPEYVIVIFRSFLHAHLSQRGVGF